MDEKIMNFLPKHVANIIAGVKTQSRRLKKEGEIFEYYVDEKGKAIYPIEVKAVMRFKTQKIKFAVGEVRQVAVKGKPVWYCPKCGFSYPYEKIENKSELSKHVRKHYSIPDDVTIIAGEADEHLSNLKPLKIKILSIKREERLTSITNADAIAEVGTGLKYPRAVFFREFLECYRDKIPKKILDDTQKLTVDVLFDPLAGTIGPMTITQAWNPLEWPIEFEVVE